jgi:hypothetical protein
LRSQKLRSGPVAAAVVGFVPLSTAQEKIMTAEGRTVVVAPVVAALTAVSCGCQKEGPAERAGKAIDDAVKRATRRIQRVDRKRAQAGIGY